MKRLILLLTSCIFFVFSCKKDKDTPAPTPEPPVKETKYTVTSDGGIINDIAEISSSLFPIKIDSDNRWLQVSCAPDFTGDIIGVKTDGTLWGWGSNMYGHLGDGTDISKSQPIQIGYSYNWKQIWQGITYTCAIQSDGTLWAWGLNSGGALGDGTTITKYSPVRVGNDTNWKDVICGSGHTLAIKTDGTLWGWGGNDLGQLGDGTTINRNIPVQIK